MVEEEANEDNYITTSSDESGTITEEGVTASFVNTKTGSLTVSKTVSGNTVDPVSYTHLIKMLVETVKHSLVFLRSQKFVA